MIELEDLKKIEDYYIIQFDVETALKVSDHILDTIERLEAFPDSGSSDPHTHPGNPGPSDLSAHCRCGYFYPCCSGNPRDSERRSAA